MGARIRCARRASHRASLQPASKHERKAAAPRLEILMTGRQLKVAVPVGGIMSLDDVEYYRRRALEERQRAAKADNAHVARAYRELAKHYEGLVARADLLPKHRQAANRNDNQA